MANLQGYITNSQGTRRKAIAHRDMEAMIRTWEGGITVTVTGEGHLRIYMGPHDNPQQRLVASGHVAHQRLVPVKEADADG